MIPVIIFCLLTSLVTSGPLNTVITRGLGPSKTFFRQLNEYQAEDQDTYFIPSKRYEESDQNQTDMIDYAAMKYQEYSPYITTEAEESPLSSNYQESSPTEKSADYNSPSMIGRLGRAIKMARDAIPNMMPVMMPALLPVLAIYIGFQIISALIQMTLGMNVSIISALNQVMRNIATSIVNFFSTAKVELMRAAVVAFLSLRH